MHMWRTKGTNAMSTTTPVDSGIEAFMPWVEMQIEPELTTGGYKGQHFTVKQSKDMTVGFVDDGDGGQTIGTIEKIVTTVKPTFDNGGYMYSGAYAELKKEFQALADEVKKNGSVVKGHILVHVNESSRDKYPKWLRLVVVNDKVVAQGARLGFEDGTQSPFPDNVDD